MKVLNSCVWQFATKHIFRGKKILEIATYCVACTFHEDNSEKTQLKVYLIFFLFTL